MKIQSLLKTSLMLTMVLALTCVTMSDLSAAPLQSGSRNADPIIWPKATVEPVTPAQVPVSQPQIPVDQTQLPISQSQVPVDQTQLPINQPQIQYDSQPVYDSQTVYDSQPVYDQHQPMAADCGCGQPACSSCAPAPRVARRGCSICKGSCGCSQCPKCEGDICKLELDKSKITKTRFLTEQESVCVPPVRLPWQKCCPPGKSKTRLVTRLKTEKYECPHCAYKWSLVEPEEAKEPEPAAAEQPQVYESTPVYDSYLPADGQQIVPTETPEVITPGTYTPPSLDSTLNTPATPATPATQSLGSPVAQPVSQPVRQPLVPKVESVVPPPPTTGSLPWRAEAPPSS